MKLDIGADGLFDSAHRTQVAGRHAEPKPEIFQYTKNFKPTNRIGTLEDSANADYLARDLAAL